MLTMGDESGHSRQGNNNPWCQDNALNHLNWQGDEDLQRFTRGLIALSRLVPALNRNVYWTATSATAKGEISWHGLQPGAPDWSAASHELAWTLALPHEPGELLMLINAGDQPARFTLPKSADRSPWRLVIDTAEDPKGTLRLPEEAPAYADPGIMLPPHALAAFWSDAQLKA